MIDRAYVQRMARYNRWQNENLYGVADGLSDDERRRERGAWFGSIHKTFNHLLWGDQAWMYRLAGTPKPQGRIPESVALYEEFNTQNRISHYTSGNIFHPTSPLPRRSASGPSVRWPTTMVRSATTRVTPTVCPSPSVLLAHC